MSEVRNLSVRRVAPEDPAERLEWIGRISRILGERHSVTIIEGRLHLSVPIELAFEHLSLRTLQKLYFDLTRVTWQVTMEFVRGERGDLLFSTLHEFREVAGEPDEVVSAAGQGDGAHAPFDLDGGQAVKESSGHGIDLHQPDAGEEPIPTQSVQGLGNVRVKTVSDHSEPLVPRRATPPP